MSSADAVMSCIQSALDDSAAGVLRFRLRNLKTFVLCTRKLGSNRSLTSLLVWIEDVVGRKAFDPSEIKSLEEEIHDWYITMFDYVLARDSASLLIHEASELITSILETLADFNATGWLKVQLEILQEQMTFLKRLVEFAVLTSPESSNQGLIAHTEVVAMDAAYLLFTCKVEGFDEAKGREMEFKISSFLLKVQPVDLQTYEIYTQVLSSSKFPIQSIAHDVDVIVAVRLVLASFLPCLRRILQQNASHVVPLMYQLQELFGGLQSLSAVLDQQLSFDVKMKEDIVAVVCDAGVLICSLYYHQTQVDLGIQNLLETVVFILAKFGVEDPRIPIFNFWGSNELGSIGILSKQLMELISCGAKPTVVSCLQTIQEELVFLKHFFMYNVKLCNELEKLRAHRDHALKMAFKLKIFTDHLEVGGDLPYSSLPLFDSIMKDIRSIKVGVLTVFRDNIHRRPMVKTSEVTWNHSERPLPRTSVMKIAIVALEDDTILLMDRLIRGTSRLRLIAVVGMPGIGKTTLATELYNALPIRYHFQVCACCQVSQVMDRKRVLFVLLNQIAPQLKEFCEWTEEDLSFAVWRSLKRRRYLIFLDDVWDIHTLDELKYSFPDDGTGSRIMLTSSLHHVTPDEEPHMVRQLSGEESLKLLQRKLFPGSDGIPMILRDLAVQIVGICKGLPLAILLAAGFLATVEPNPDVWNKILYDLSSRGIVSSSDVCMNILDLSYEYLPDYLKLCFLYFATFQNDEEVPVRRLFRLWIAEGFVQKKLVENLEVVAAEYLVDLIGRELIMVAKRKSIGGVKACLVHDLVHDFCLKKAKDENFFHFLNGYDDPLAYNNESDLWRLIIDSRLEHLKESKFCCPQVRSLISKSSQQTRDEQGLFLDISFLTRTLRFLHVLDIEQINVGHVFPSELEGLIHLAFLAIRGNMRQIPSSIDTLSNLETLILDAGTEIVALPDSLENLRSLQFLYVRSLRSSGGATFPATNLENPWGLLGLGTFCGVVVPSWGILESLMRKFPNIRRLKCRRAMDYTDDVEKIVLPNFLSQLESLHLSSVNSCHVEFCLPEHLKKLTLSGFHLIRENISTIGQIPNLEVLKLLHVSFEGYNWDMEEEEFMKLKVLKLHSPRLVRWTASDEALGSLSKLTLEGCKSLQEIPATLEMCFTIEVIEVYHCSSTVVSMVRQIVECQADYGYEVKVIVSGCEF